MGRIPVATICAAILATAVPKSKNQEIRHFSAKHGEAGQGLPGSYCRAPPALGIVRGAVGKFAARIGWIPDLPCRLNVLLTAQGS
jgi:hypothetical protein